MMMMMKGKEDWTQSGPFPSNPQLPTLLARLIPTHDATTLHNVSALRGRL